MSRSAKMLRRLERAIPGSFVCKNFLVIPPAGRILRALLVEATPYRGLVHVWWFVLPLYVPRKNVNLNHGDRILSAPRDTHFRIDPDAFDASVETVREAIIAGGHVERLRGIASPANFLALLGKATNTWPIAPTLDYALTLCLVGETVEALAHLRRLRDELPRQYPRTRAIFEPTITRALRCLESHPDGIVDLLNEWEEANVVAFGLQKARPT